MAAAERLQKLIAAAGITSRRKAEDLITAGRVTVNGIVVREIGGCADIDEDEIRVDDRILRRPERVYLALNKPRGVVTSVSDPHAERVVIDLLGPEVTARVFPAGRLDRDSEGLVILTNDGELMQAMTRPGGGVDKVYSVLLAGVPRAADLRRLRQGCELDGRTLLPCAIEAVTPTDSGCRYRVVLHEGKKHQIRRMFRQIGTPVRRLRRLRVGPVRLGQLRPGEYRALSDRERDELCRLAGVPGAGR